MSTRKMLLRVLSWPLQSDFDELTVQVSPSSRIVEHHFTHTTVLFVDIQNFTSTCALLGPANTGTWIQTFYDTVHALCDKHHALLVELRGDCCVCAARGSLQASNILALCRDLHELLGERYALRMGVTTGAVNFLKGPTTLCAYGSTSQTADALQALTAPGVALVHWATLSRWGHEKGQSSVMLTRLVQDRQGRSLQVADYDLRCGAFVVRRSVTF